MELKVVQDKTYGIYLKDRMWTGPALPHRQTMGLVLYKWFRDNIHISERWRIKGQKDKVACN